MPRGGKRIGAGRKKGSPDTKPRVPQVIRLDAQTLYRERVEKELKPLLDATVRSACGEQFIFGLDGGRWRVITDPKVIERLLDSGESFYRIATKSPDARVLCDTWDRILGKPVQPMNHSGATTLEITWKS